MIVRSFWILNLIIDFLCFLDTDARDKFTSYPNLCIVHVVRLSIHVFVRNIVGVRHS